MNYAITNTMLQELIDRLPRVFDSHALIFLTMQVYPQEFTRDLYLYVDAVDPILQHNAAFARRLHSIDSIEATDRKVPSLNCRGETNENQEWRRR
jgi:hypothetical protein